MNATINSPENFNELVFENRNKQYGAYVLRKSYKNNMTVAMIIATFFIGVLLLLAVKWNSGNLIPQIAGMLTIDSLMTIEYVETEVDMTPPEEKTEKPVEDSKAYSDPLNGEASDDPSDDDIKPKDIAVVNPLGDQKGADTTAKDPGTIHIAKPADKAKKDAVAAAYEMPDFEGGILKYVSENLKYPPIAVENGTEGVVYLSFVVEEDGAVSGVKVLRGIGDGCEQEAMRVLKSMPKWKPGKDQLGEPLRVVFNLPVKFRIK